MMSQPPRGALAGPALTPSDGALLHDGLVLLLQHIASRANSVIKARIEAVIARMGRSPMPTGLSRELESILSAVVDPAPIREGADPTSAGLGREASTLARAFGQVAVAIAIRDARIGALAQSLLESVPTTVTVGDARRLSRQAESLLLLAGPAQARVREEKAEMSRLIAELGVELNRMGETGSAMGQHFARLADDLREENLPVELRAARAALLQRVRVAASETERLRQGLRDAQRRAQTLESIVATQARALIDLQSRAALDPLTQICNRGAFDQALPAYVERAHSMNRPLVLVVLDIDHFKKVNDQWGHPAGDEVLRKVAASLHEHVREGDVIARLGGEELAVLLERANLKAGFTAADRMRQSIGALQVPIYNEAGELITQITVTVSGGVAQLRPREDGAGLYRRADVALYKAKQAGRNQVCVDQPTRPPG